MQASATVIDKLKFAGLLLSGGVVDGNRLKLG
jgi:hypothetical protein